MLQQKVCSEKKNQTSFIIHEGRMNEITNGRNIQRLTVSKKILLQQQPEEVVDLDFVLSYGIKHYHDGFSRNNCQLDYNFLLTFQNNLHEISKDYGYEIELYQQVKENEMLSHTLLFSEKHSRKSMVILIKDTCDDSIQSTYSNFLDKLLIDTDDRHICCRIRRYNTKTTVVDVHQELILNIGAMLLEQELYSDVSLVVGEQIFKVHKEILSSSSDVFKTMFSQEMIEVQNGKVIIVDFDPDVVEGLLSFIYTGKTSLLSKKPIELFQIAHKYEIHYLKAQCAESFLFLVNKKNVVDMLVAASVYELIDFEANLKKFISIHEEEMVKEKSYQQYLSRNLKLESVVNILKMCDKYKQFLHGVEIITFQFVKKNNKDLVRNEEFLQLFESNPSLMKRLYVFIHQND